MKEKNQQTGALISIAGIIGGVSIVIVTIFAIFIPDQITVSAYIVGILAVMALGLGKFAAAASSHKHVDTRQPRDPKPES